MKTIYRLEVKHKTRKIGLGPYTNNNKIRRYLEDSLHSSHTTEKHHPSRYEDFIKHGLSVCDQHYFACKTIKSLTNWFEEFIETGYDYGLSVAVYKVKEIKTSYSKKQVIFLKEDIISKKYLTLDEYQSIINS